MSIELRVLRYVIAVAEEGGFQRAAARLHIAQPPLSRQIGALESKLGVRLFERRPTRPTVAGQVFVESARRILADADTMVTRTVRAGLGAVRLGYMTGAAHETLSRLIAALPGLRVETREGWSPGLERAVRDERLDAALTYAAGGDCGLVREAVRTERLFAVVRAGHRLTGRTAIGLRDLRGDALVLAGRHLDPGYHNALRNALHSTGETFGVREAAIPDVQHFPLCGLRSFTAVPESMGRDLHGDLTGIPLLDDLPPLTLSIAWKAGVVGAAVSALRDAAREPSGSPCR
jgi:DNA-binding transcriptional LysR family regulator